MRDPGRSRSRRQYRRRRAGLALVVVVLAAVCLVVAAGAGGPPLVSVRALVPAQVAVRAVAPTSPWPWPAGGAGAVSVPTVGFTAQSGPEQPVPVASLTKIMTGYLVLRDHPLGVGQSGPAIPITAADVANFGMDTVTDQANVQLVPGEVLSEYQMLQGLLVHSANDLAFALANWDAGSEGAFVVKMNLAARQLGMRDTHFVDASGFQPASQSTAADILKVSAAAMANPVFAGIVTETSVTLPVAGPVMTYTPMLTTPGVIGVKSGFTTAAGGCDVLAYRTDVAGRPVTVLAAVTSLHGPTVLEAAGRDALALAQAAAARLVAADIVHAGSMVAQIRDGTQRVGAVAAAGAALLAAGGADVSARLRVTRRPTHGTPAGATIGTLTLAAGTQEVSVAVRTTAAVP